MDSLTYTVPDYVDSKGSLFLRSNHMNYSAKTLNSNWHQAREAHPKDYDVTQFPEPPERNMHTTTYKRIGNLQDEFEDMTTTKLQLEQIHLKPEFTEQDNIKKVVDVGSFHHADIERKVENIPSRGFGAVLPGHHPDHDKMHLDTTHTTDFAPPYPYTPGPKTVDLPDNSAAYRKCHSQFTDRDGYKRKGVNTFYDESGVYANAEIKSRVFPKTNPIPDRLAQGLL